MLARVWQGRYAIVLGLVYMALFFWLFAETGDALDGRPKDFEAIPTRPQWEAPNENHRFGTTADGADLYVLSRAAMARSSAIAAITCTAGVLLSFLLTLLFVYDGADRMLRTKRNSSKGRFTLLLSSSRMIGIVPAMIVLCILLGGSEGSLLITLISFPLVIAVYSCSSIVQWFEEEEAKSDRVAALVLGLHSAKLVKTRSIPSVVKRLLGLTAMLLPGVILLEISLSFLGFTGGALSCGTIIASGRESLLEAPWVTIYPGILSGVVVAVFALLGRITNRMLRMEESSKIL